MKIKVKLSIGITLLFLLIIALAITGTLFIYRLANDSNRIIQDNYATLEYSRDMQLGIQRMQSLKMGLLNGVPDSSLRIKKEIPEARALFESNLEREARNITEPGEQEAFSDLKRVYNDYLDIYQEQHPSLKELESRFNMVQERIENVFNINLGAMKAKSHKAKDSGDEAILYISILGTGAVLLAFVLLLNFPGYIANPLIDITSKIKEIAKKNYDQQLIYPNRNDEVGELAKAFNTMSSKLMDYEKSNIAELMTEKSRIDSIVRNLDEGIILLDENQIVKVINPVAINLLGLEAENVLEKYAPDIAISNDLFRELIKNISQEVSSDGKPIRITVGNEENFFQKEVFKVQRENVETKVKETAGYIISLRNITEFKKLDLAKTNFIAVVSHELKTPISSINLSLKLMEDERVGSLNEEQRNLVQSVKDETVRLSKITGELLDISQVETGNIKLHIDNVNPEEIVKIAEEVLKPHLKEKRIDLINEVSKDIPLIKADLEKTVWVMTNLLVNAVRYTPDEGKIRIGVHPSLKEVQFTVEDTGPGIDPKNRERIFQRFVQVDGKQKREGVGLGLAISKEFIQEQGGRIWVESELGVGSKFVFTLPRG